MAALLMISPSVGPQACLAALRAAGAGRVSDHFLLPVSETAHSYGPRSVLRLPVRGRGHERDCWVRVADVPFDLLPYRPRACDRIGAFFSLGPGLTREGVEHPSVVQVQVEGPPETIAAVQEAVERAVDATLTARRSSTAEEGGWLRVCHAGLADGLGRPR